MASWRKLSKAWKSPVAVPAGQRRKGTVRPRLTAAELKRRARANRRK